MGKMKMGHDHRNKTPRQIAPEAVTADLDATIKAVLSTHFETFKKLAEAEKSEPLATMAPSCQCTPPPVIVTPNTKDSHARKHTLLLKKEVKEDQKQLDLLLAKYAKDTDDRLKRLELGLDIFLEEKPQQIQVVKEIIVEKPVMDKRMLLIIAISTLLNLALVLLK